MRIGEAKFGNGLQINLLDRAAGMLHYHSVPAIKATARKSCRLHRSEQSAT
jgi:hypothetical protein